MHDTSAVRHTISDQLESNSTNFLILKFIAIKRRQPKAIETEPLNIKLNTKEKTTDDQV